MTQSFALLRTLARRARTHNAQPRLSLPVLKCNRFVLTTPQTALRTENQSLRAEVQQLNRTVRTQKMPVCPSCSRLNMQVLSASIDVLSLALLQRRGKVFAACQHRILKTWFAFA